MQRLHPKNAFTIIELLVVMVVIALLTGAATVSYTTAQRNARDDSRKQGVSAIATAAEAFYQVERTFPGVIVAGPGNQIDKFVNCIATEDIGAPVKKIVAYYSPPSGTVCQTANPGNSDRIHTSTSMAERNWIPGLAAYLSPYPSDPLFRNAASESEPIPSANLDALGGAYALGYRRTDSGFAAYARLENKADVRDYPCAGNGADRQVNPIGPLTGVVQDGVVISCPATTTDINTNRNLFVIRR